MAGGLSHGDKIFLLLARMYRAATRCQGDRMQQGGDYALHALFTIAVSREGVCYKTPRCSYICDRHYPLQCGYLPHTWPPSSGLAIGPMSQVYELGFILN